MTKPCLLRLLATALLLIGVPAAQADEASGITASEIIIGSSSALTGQTSFLGTQLTQGSQAFFKHVNEKGGIHGRKLRFIRYDDQYTPALCLTNTEKLVNQDKVFLLFDYVGTPTAKVVIRFINENRVPVLGMFTGAEFLRTPFQPYIFNIRASYFMEDEAMIDYWIAAGITKIAVFYQDDVYGKTVLEGVKLALARFKREPITTATFTRGGMPSPEAVESIAAASPQAVVMVGTYTPLARFVEMAKERGLTRTKFHTVSFVGSEAFARELLAYRSGVETNVYVTQVVPSPYDRRNPAVREFLEIYRRYYPSEAPNYVALEGFINAKILVEALRRCGPEVTRSKVMAVLESMSDYNAGTGLPSVIGPDYHSFFEKVMISRIQNGNFQVVNTEPQ